MPSEETDSKTGGETLTRETKSLMRGRQKVPLSLSGDLAPVKSISVTPDHRLDIPMTGLQIFTHNPTGPWSQSVPAAQRWPLKSYPPYYCYIRGEQITH